jgi:hypothetical protein
LQTLPFKNLLGIAFLPKDFTLLDFVWCLEALEVYFCNENYKFFIALSGIEKSSCASPETSGWQEETDIQDIMACEDKVCS